MSYTTVSETVAAYDEMLDQLHTFPEVAGITFPPSEILRELDPIAYVCGWIDWCEAEGIDTDELEDDYTFTRDTW